MADVPATIILLAGQRHGVVNPLAERAGVSHKCLAPIRGRPLIEHVLDTLTALPAIKGIRISLESDAHAEVGALLARYAGAPMPITLLPNAPNIVDSVLAAAGDDPGPFIVTTADNVLLTAAGVEQLRDALTRADAVLGVTTKERVLAAHPDGQRNFYEFREGGYANCNLYGLANRKALAAAEIFREGGQFQANAGRMVRAFGLFNIVLMRLGLISLPRGIERIGRRFGVEMRATIFEDGALAIDVDNERTYRVCEELLARRAG